MLDDEEYNQQVAQAEAELEVAKASVEEARSNLEAAQREFDRVEALRGKKIAAESELDEARSQYRTALARHKVALSQVAQKEASLRGGARSASPTPQIRARWSGGGDSADGRRAVRRHRRDAGGERPDRVGGRHR